jgi:hypothetical protein
MARDQAGTPLHLLLVTPQAMPSRFAAGIELAADDGGLWLCAPSSARRNRQQRELEQPLFGMTDLLGLGSHRVECAFVCSLKPGSEQGMSI